MKDGLWLEDASFRYGDLWVLRETELHVPPGRTLIVTGDNGVGKSTLLYVCAGLLNASAGHVWLDGHLAAAKKPSELMRQGVPIGTVNSVPQAFRQAHAEHREMRIEGDGYRGIGVPTKLSRTPGRPGSPPPSFGQHADEVLLQAGLGRSRIAELRECGVLKQRP